MINGSTHVKNLKWERFIERPTGDVVAQLVERRPQDPMDSMTRGSNPIRTQEKHLRVFTSQNVVLTGCRCAPPPWVHAHIRMITYAR